METGQLAEISMRIRTDCRNRRDERFEERVREWCTNLFLVSLPSLIIWPGYFKGDTSTWTRIPSFWTQMILITSSPSQKLPPFLKKSQRPSEQKNHRPKSRQEKRRNDVLWKPGPSHHISNGRCIPSQHLALLHEVALWSYGFEYWRYGYFVPFLFNLVHGIVVWSTR